MSSEKSISIRETSQYQEVIYEQLQEKILFGEYSHAIIDVLHKYEGEISKRVFEITDWKTFGGTLMHCILGRLTEFQLDYFGLFPQQPIHEGDEQIAEFDGIDYIIRHVIDTYNPDLTILDPDSNSFLDIIKTTSVTDTPLTPWVYHEFTSTEQGRSLLSYLHYHYNRQIFVKTIQEELITKVKERGPLSLSYLAFMNMTTSDTINAMTKIE